MASWWRLHYVYLRVFFLGRAGVIYTGECVGCGGGTERGRVCAVRSVSCGMSAAGISSVYFRADSIRTSTALSDALACHKSRIRRQRARQSFPHVQWRCPTFPQNGDISGFTVSHSLSAVRPGPSPVARGLRACAAPGLARSARAPAVANQSYAVANQSYAVANPAPARAWRGPQKHSK
jgi:hypothetical protein